MSLAITKALACADDVYAMIKRKKVFSSMESTVNAMTILVRRIMVSPVVDEVDAVTKNASVW